MIQLVLLGGVFVYLVTHSLNPIHSLVLGLATLFQSLPLLHGYYRIPWKFDNYGLLAPLMGVTINALCFGLSVYSPSFADFVAYALDRESLPTLGRFFLLSILGVSSAVPLGLVFAGLVRHFYAQSPE